mmetsp:Transcript_4530/g.19284  ORF Transcript_4530/g.19284 Transcript_4530/m.19284 type:complete len:206 (-) Transcript_4530:1389-2006(-)
MARLRLQPELRPSPPPPPLPPLLPCPLPSIDQCFSQSSWQSHAACACPLKSSLAPPERASPRGCRAPRALPRAAAAGATTTDESAADVETGRRSRPGVIRCRPRRHNFRPAKPPLQTAKPPTTSATPPLSDASDASASASACWRRRGQRPRPPTATGQPPWPETPRPRWRRRRCSGGFLRRTCPGLLCGRGWTLSEGCCCRRRRG